MLMRGENMKGRLIARFMTMLCCYTLCSAAQSSHQANPYIVTGHPFSATIVTTYQPAGSGLPAEAHFGQYDRDSEGRERWTKLDSLDDSAPLNL